MDTAEVDRCEVCGDESPERFSSWECMARGVAPELEADIYIKAVEGTPSPTVQSRDGWILAAAREFDIYDLWLAGTVTDEAMASMIKARSGKRPAVNSLYRARQAGKEQQGLERISETWTMDSEVAHFIATDHDHVIRVAAEKRDSRSIEILVDDLVDWFVGFRNRYFTLGRDRPYITAEFHREWIAAILTAYFTGGKVIQSPADEWDEFLPIAEEILAGVSFPDMEGG